MSEPHCLALDQPVEAEINKVLNSYINGMIAAHSKVNQEDYNAIAENADFRSDDGSLVDPPEYKNLSTQTIKNGSGSKINLGSQLELYIRARIPIVELYEKPAAFSAKKVQIQQEYNDLVVVANDYGDESGGSLRDPSVLAPGDGVLVGGPIELFGLSYNDLKALSSSKTPQLNEFLILYSSLASICSPDFEKDIKYLYQQALVDWFVFLKASDERKKLLAGEGTLLQTLGLLGALGTGIGGEALLREAAEKAVKEAIGDIEEEVENIFAEVKLYQEQCFVLSQLNELIRYKQTNSALTPRLPYLKTEKNAPILMQGEPFGFMNRLVQYPSAKALFNLTTAQISSLVPTIRLYRVETDPATGKDIGVTEIKFDPNPAVKSYENGKSALDLFSDKKKRGYGVGLQSFDFTFHGSDPFAVKKAIQAKLSIFATSFGDLITERAGYKFSDLALKTGKTPDDLRNNLDIIDQQNLDKLNFRLKAVVGWAVPKELVGSFDFSEIDAVNNSFVTLNLTPTTHEFSFDEMGGVVFTINYLAYIEDYFNQTKFNIFADPKIEAIRNARKLFYEFVNTQGCDQESLDIIKEADAKIIQNEKRRSFSSILSNLRKQNKLLTYNISYDDVSKFLRTGRVSDSNSLVPKTFDSSSGDAIQAAFNTYSDANSSSDPNERERVAKLTQEDNAITFFFISDLLSIIMESIDDSFNEITEVEKELDFLKIIEAQNIYDDGQKVSASLIGNFSRKGYVNFLNNRGGKEYKQSLLKAKAQFEKLRLVFGPVEIRNPFKTAEVQFCSIGDIPLSLNYFTEFLTKKMIGRDETYYPLTNFVKDLVNDVIKNFLNNDGCFDFGIRQKLKLNSTVVAAYNSTENRYHDTTNSGYEIAKEEFEEGQTPLDDITYYIGNNRITQGEPGFGAGNVFDLTKTGIQPILQVSGPDRSPVVKPPIGREMNYYVFYAGRSYPTDLMTGDEGVDSQNGIFHYVLGKDRGIVKNISLDRTDMNGLKELRFEKEGFDGLTQLREVYNASIDCFLNVSALPGSYIYVDPRGFSPEAGVNYSQFGIGGYYMITRAEHSIAPGKADTQIVAKWVADTNGRIESAENGNFKTVDRNPNNKTAQKCLAKVRKPKPRVTTKSAAVDEINKRSGGTGLIHGSAGKI